MWRVSELGCLIPERKEMRCRRQVYYPRGFSCFKQIDQPCRQYKRPQMIRRERQLDTVGGCLPVLYDKPGIVDQQIDAVVAGDDFLHRLFDGTDAGKVAL